MSLKKNSNFEKKTLICEKLVPIRYIYSQTESMIANRSIKIMSRNMVNGAQQQQQLHHQQPPPHQHHQQRPLSGASSLVFPSNGSSSSSAMAAANVVAQPTAYNDKVSLFYGIVEHHKSAIKKARGNQIKYVFPMKYP